MVVSRRIGIKDIIIRIMFIRSLQGRNLVAGMPGKLKLVPPGRHALGCVVIGTGGIKIFGIEITVIIGGTRRQIPSFPQLKTG